MLYMEALKKIKAKEYPPVLLFYGSESFFIQQLKDELQKAVFSHDVNEESVSYYDLEETPIEEIVIDAETFPFFSDRKLIIAENPTFLLARQPKLPFNHDLEQLETYLQQPVDYSIILFIAPYDKLDQRKKLTKLLKKQALVVECQSIKEQEFANWAKQIAAELHVTIEADVIDLLASELQLNLQLVQNELHKLALYVGEGGMITIDVARELLSRTDNSSALRLVDAVIEQDLHEAISIYQELAKNNEEPIALIALLAYQYRMIYRVKLLKQKGYSQFQMREQLNVHPYVIKMALGRERQFTEAMLKSIMHALTEADTHIKMGKMDKHMAFELLLFELVQTVKARQIF